MFGHNSGGRVKNNMQKRGWSRQTVSLNEQDSILEQKGSLEDLEVEAGIESYAYRETGFQLQVDTGGFFLLEVSTQSATLTPPGNYQKCKFSSLTPDNILCLKLWGVGTQIQL